MAEMAELCGDSNSDKLGIVWDFGEASCTELEELAYLRVITWLLVAFLPCDDQTWECRLRRVLRRNSD